MCTSEPIISVILLILCFGPSHLQYQILLLVPIAIALTNCEEFCGWNTLTYRMQSFKVVIMLFFTLSCQVLKILWISPCLQESWRNRYNAELMDSSLNHNLIGILLKYLLYHSLPNLCNMLPTYPDRDSQAVDTLPDEIL